MLWKPDRDLRPLADAIRPGVTACLEALGASVPDVTVVGSGSGPPCQVVGAHIVLSDALLGPDLYVGEDATRPPALALDRFRRATGLVAEAALMHAHAAELDMPVEALRDAWWGVGRAAEAVDRGLPALGWLWAPLADLLTQPGTSCATAPRRMAWWFRFLRETRRPAGDADAVPVDAWAAFGLWLRDRQRGPLAACPLPLDPAPATPPPGSPWVAPALSLWPLRLTGGAAGTTWSATGGAFAGATHLAPGGDGVAVLGAVTGSELAVTAGPAGPVGAWSLASGHFGAHVGAARGVELTLGRAGRVELTGADAFVGPPTQAVLAMADQYGVSGAASGTWRLVSVAPDGRSGVLTLHGIDGDATVHPRSGHGFALPAGDWLEPVRGVLRMLDGRPIRWTLDGARLVTRVDLGGTEMAFHFEPGA